MSKIMNSIDQLIGKTPLYELKGIEAEFQLKTKLLAKLEMFNPGGSVKDRAAKKMLDEAEQKGLINSKTVIIEPTSGNTGIGLSAIGAARGYRVIIVMPENMSEERQMLMKAYGAELVLTDASKGMAGAIEKAEALKKTFPDHFIPNQFENLDNAAAHYETTGPEIWTETDGKVDCFVAGIGTGGTITGTGRFLKEQNPSVQVIGVEPIKSPLLTQGISGPHGLQGIGANFIPDVLDRTLLDEVIAVSDEAAYEMVRLMVKKEGLLVGITSGAALWAAIQFAQREENAGKNIITLLPDTGERYLSTGIFK